MEAAARPAPRAVAKPTGEVLLEVTELRTRFALRGSFAQRMRGRAAGSVKAVDGVSFSLRRGEVLGVVGESGSGKTTLGRTLLGLAAATDGSIKLEGQEITGLSEAAFRPLRLPAPDADVDRRAGAGSRAAAQPIAPRTSV